MSKTASLASHPTGPTLQNHLACCRTTKAWLSACPGLLKCTNLSTQEWHDAFSGPFLTLWHYPAAPPQGCDGCSHPNSLKYALNSMMGGLVTLCSNNDIWQELAAIACYVSVITIEPPLLTTLAATDPPGCLIHNDPPTAPLATLLTTLIEWLLPTAEQGDLAIHGLFACSINAIIDVCTTNHNSVTSRISKSFKAVQHHKADKWCKNQAICHPHLEYSSLCSLCWWHVSHPITPAPCRTLSGPPTKIVLHGNATSKASCVLPLTLVKAVHHYHCGSHKKCLLHTPCCLALTHVKNSKIQYG